MRKYKLIVLLAILSIVDLCIINDVLSVEKSFVTNDTKDEEIEVMLRTLKREKEELGKLKSEFKGAFKIIKDETEEQIEKIVEKKRKMVLTDFVKKGVGKREGAVDEQNSFALYKEDGEAKKVIALESEAEDVDETEKVVVNDGEEIIHPFEIAENLYKLGEYEAALDIYQLIIKNDVTKDKKMWISYQIANCYRKLGSNTKAVEAYKEIQDVYEGTYWAKQSQWYIQDIKWRAKAEQQIEKVIER